MENRIENDAPRGSWLTARRAVAGTVITGFVLAMLVCAGCGRSGPQPKSTDDDASTASDSAATAKPAGEKPGTMRDVAEVRALLKAMAEAYAKASSYQDVAEVRIRGRVNGKPFSEKWNYGLTMERPNKLRLHAYQGTAVCDGTNLLAWVAGIPNQVLKVPAPAEVDIATIFVNNVLADSIANGPTQQFAWVPLQMVLLYSKNPLNTLLFEAKETRLLDPADIDGRKCLRVQVRRADGTCVFWIDEKSHILRRFEFPIEQMSGEVDGSKVEVLSLAADFHRARFNEPIDPKAFWSELPPDADLVDELAPTAVQMLGKTSSDFIFVGLDGKPLTLKSLSGKTALIEFWSVSIKPSRDALAQIEKVYQKFKDNPKTAFFAVSIDRGDVTNEQLEKAFDEMGVSVPIYRISQKDADQAFKIRGIPTTVILGPDGRVQDYQPGMVADAAAVINQEIEHLLAGKDLAVEMLHISETKKLRYAEIFAAMANQDMYVNPVIIVRRMAVAQKSRPKFLKLEPLWARAEIKDSSGILVVPQDGNTAGEPTGGPVGGPRIFVAHGGRSVAELDTGGNIVAKHSLQLPQQELVTRLRTFKGKDGKRLYLGITPGMQQVHLFDENWKRISSFPEDARKNPHAGVGDAWIADMDGDGSGEIVAGYLGLVGVKSIASDGKVRWSNRSIANVFSMAVGGPDQNGRRPLYCVNGRTALAALDAGGKMQRELSLDGRLLFAIAAENLGANSRANGPQMELCGLSSPRLGENLAVGLDPQGNLLWSYQMPKGTFAGTAQRICGARLAEEGAGQWVLLGPDGSVHVVGIDGKPIDQFNYGAAVTGLAATSFSGRPVLLIGSRQGVEALAVGLAEGK